MIDVQINACHQIIVINLCIKWMNDIKMYINSVWRCALKKMKWLNDRVMIHGSRSFDETAQWSSLRVFYSIDNWLAARASMMPWRLSKIYYTIDSQCEWIGNTIGWQVGPGRCVCYSCQFNGIYSKCARERALAWSHSQSAVVLRNESFAWN